MKKLLFVLLLAASIGAAAQSTTFPGDLGTFTATHTGTSQFNATGFSGAYIYLQLGTVSGTSPTLSVQFQWSPDGGTTWISLGPALTNLTASSTTGVILVYPTAFASGGSAGTALTTGATATLLLNMRLPTYWRLNYTIGGTTPSFVVSAVQAQLFL